MCNIRVIYKQFILFILVSTQFTLYASEYKPETARTFINLIDYIGKDYSLAIKNGKVINDFEYQEMKAFADEVINLHDQLNPLVNKAPFTALEPQLNYLKQDITNKLSPDSIRAHTNYIKQELLKLQLVSIKPDEWPAYELGRELYVKQCLQCHGKQGRGDGPASQGLEPPPTNFQSPDVMEQLSPFQAYNTIRLGIEGTSMVPYKNLSDKEVWSLAFYINSMYYGKEISEKEQKEIIDKMGKSIDLASLATTSNKNWEKKLQAKGIDITKGMALIRQLERPVTATDNDKEQPLKLARDLLNESFKAYQIKDYDNAHTLALDAYLQGIEPIESSIKASNPKLVNKLEGQMIKLRSAIKKEKPVNEVSDHVNATLALIDQSEKEISEDSYSFWFTFPASLSILIREALEAFLVIMVIMGVLRSVNAKNAIKYVHAGWISALIIGIVCWFFADRLMNISAANREIMEGLGSIIAVAILMYIGFWLHSKTHAKQWNKFVKEKIHRLLDTNNLIGLAFLSFVVVFREAIESVIFLSTISVKADPSGQQGIFIGALASFGIVILFCIASLKYSKRIPIMQLFKYSAYAMVILSFVLIGKGIHEFQEAGFLSINTLPVYFNFSLLGIYSTYETLFAQLSVILIAYFLWQYNNKKLAQLPN